ncbi:FAD-binding and (Fe-S)-binding domain-containing protein [Arthrobacter sp. BE255]|uniref:FAD-binding and (Fe-S)-binding domain-containing protein n=1 Tax=Arthrobacter sp. BE255 TaxID=2817721 RepID=UPI00285BA102|nr:FAD-binding and (Fe-S)-binding domain-containing protein [Arthrobacter sp. BE255]MDR7158407.1 D-lactate dehydrogenase [Arthrobacter sp. BE255]
MQATHLEGAADRADVKAGDRALAASLRAALGVGNGAVPPASGDRSTADADVSVEVFDRVVAGVDASHFLLTPAAVVRARSIEDVSAAFRYARGHRRSITLRSGGTSLSGQASGEDLLIDVRGAFRDIRPAADGSTVVVQPGATIRQVNARLLRHGRKLGPDPASEIAATVGGVVANNSSGMACGTEFNSYRTVRSLRFVLASGTVVDTSVRDADERLAAAEPSLHAGLARLRDEIRADPALTAEILRQYRGKNTMGYGLKSFLDFDAPAEILAHLMVGSEGSLGFIAEVEFGTVPIPVCAATALVIFDDLEQATRILPVLVGTGAATIELMDAASLRVVQNDPASADILAGVDIASHAALLIEYQGKDEDELGERLREARVALATAGTPPFEPTAHPKQRAHLWHARKGLYAAIAGARRPGTTALLEDIAVPVPLLAPTCASLQRLFAEYGYNDAVIFGHAKDGNIHFLITEDFTADGAVERQRAFTEDLVELVLEAGGTLKAEHGTGRIMAPFVERQFGRRLYQIMLEVKRLCDPAGILNPGVLIGDDPESHLAHLKLNPVVEPEVDRCVECGYCEPVCPSRDVTITPRQRIAVRRARAAATARGDSGLDAELARAETYNSVETCAVDGMCQTACPVSINTGDLVRRLREQDASRVTQAAGRAAAGQWAAVTRMAATALTAAKWLPAPLVRGASDAARAVLGTDVVPRWTGDLPAGGSRRAGVDRPAAEKPAQAVFFASCTGSMFGPAKGSIGAAEAFRRLCARAGVGVVIPPAVDGLCCGTPWKSKGLTDGFAEMAGRTVASLLTASDGGRLPIVTDNSSCTEGLLHALDKVRASGGGTGQLRIIDSVDFAAAELLPHLRVHEQVASIVLHPTCASTRLGTNEGLRALAGAVSGQAVVPDAWGCCGFAGDRGMLHPELTASATRAEAVEVASGDFEAHASCNRTCEIGMSRATGKEYRHILEILEERTRA